MASVSWISLPAPLDVCFRQEKMVGVNTYLPMEPKCEGASSGRGFSTMSSSRRIFSPCSLPLTIPYRVQLFFGTFWIARTDDPVFSKISISCFVQGIRSFIISSPSSTANGSSPQCFSAHRTASPKSLWLTLADKMDTGKAGYFPESVELLALAMAFKVHHEFRSIIKIILDGAFPPPGNQENVIDA